MPLTVPSPLAPLYGYFPLLLVEDSTSSSTTPPPKIPTLWLLGPPPTTSTTTQSESLDPHCRQLQAYIRFLGLEHQVKWCRNGNGSPGGTLPSLHLPKGDLIDSENVYSTLSKISTGGTSSSEKQDEEESEEVEVDPIVQAYTSLISTTLLPSIYASLYLTPTEHLSVTPSIATLPWLSRMARNYLSTSERRDRLKEVGRMRGGGKAGGGKTETLDLEELEREAKEALEAIEEKFGETSAQGGKWFLGSTHPTQLDALLYSLVSLTSILPTKGSNRSILRQTLERSCPRLEKWYKSLEPK